MITVHEAAKKWNLTERRVTACCRDGKIAGAKKDGKTWLIPENSLKPNDGRFKPADNNGIVGSSTTTKFTEKGALDNVFQAFSRRTVSAR